MAEIELSVLHRQCLNRRSENATVVEQETRVWQQERNARVVKVNWQFTTAYALVKLRRLYPEVRQGSLG